MKKMRKTWKLRFFISLYAIYWVDRICYLYLGCNGVLGVKYDQVDSVGTYNHLDRMLLSRDTI